MGAALTPSLLALGLLVVTPLALTAVPVTLPATRRDASRAPSRRSTRRLVPLAPLARPAVAVAIPAAVSLALPRGPVAVAAALPWALLALVALARALPVLAPAAAELRTDPRAALRTAVPAAAAAWWVIGTAWLLLDRAGVDPLGVGGTLVQLTAVHFHFAGLAATAVVGRSDARRGDDRLLPALVGVLLAPPVVALGFAALPAMQVLGAVLFTLALWWWAAAAGDIGGGPARRCAWALARLSVVISMPLATWWALSWVLGVAGPSIPLVAAIHGTANALGFALAGLLALRAAR